MKVFRVLHVPTGKYLPADPFTFEDRNIAELCMNNMAVYAIKDPDSVDRFVQLDIETIQDDLPNTITTNKVISSKLFDSAERCYALLHSSVFDFYTPEEREVRDLAEANVPYDSVTHWSWLIPCNLFEIVECNDKSLDVYYDNTPIPITRKDIHELIEILSESFDDYDTSAKPTSLSKCTNLIFKPEVFNKLKELVKTIQQEI